MAVRRPNGAANGKRLATPQSVNAAIKSICDIMRRSNCAGALQYVPELTWILFLRILDEREAREAEQAEAVGAECRPSLEAPYRWRDWAAPDGPKRTELQLATFGSFFGFVKTELIPHLKKLRELPNATSRLCAGTLHCSSGRRCRRKAPIGCFPGRHSGPAWWRSRWWLSTWCFGSGSVVSRNCF